MGCVVQIGGCRLHVFERLPNLAGGRFIAEQHAGCTATGLYAGQNFVDAGTRRSHGLADLFRHRIIPQQHPGGATALLQTGCDVIHVGQCGIGGVQRAAEFQAMKAGAVEFLTKPFTNAVLLSAIRQALERSRIALLQDEEMQGLRDRYASLSLREQEVMALVVRGLLNKQVAAELGITEFTVKTHRGRILQKMKADSLAALVEMARRLRSDRTRQRCVSARRRTYKLVRGA
ncbi:MAG: hypothetical protein JO099_09970 [Acidobacteriia bacterium]|nr:hypothetical protein [Terriglobia bacterium]